MATDKPTSLRDYTPRASEQITFVEGEFYPDVLDAASELYTPVLQRFGELLGQARDSCDLLTLINRVTKTKQRVQLLRVFRKYVSPDTSVEMLKKKSAVPTICKEFGGRFRKIALVRQAWARRPCPDEAIIAVLNEYRNRGQKGYGLAADFFEWFEMAFPEEYTIRGPRGPGSDINLAKVLRGYPKDRRPVDFVVQAKGVQEPLVVGLIRYDSDRGGAQEDDRTSGYRNVVTEVDELLEQARVAAGRRAGLGDAFSLADAASGGSAHERPELAEDLARGAVDLAHHRLTVEEQLTDVHADGHQDPAPSRHSPSLVGKVSSRQASSTWTPAGVAGATLATSHNASAKPISKVSVSS